MTMTCEPLVVRYTAEARDDISRIVRELLPRTQRNYGLLAWLFGVLGLPMLAFTVLSIVRGEARFDFILPGVVFSGMFYLMVLSRRRFMKIDPTAVEGVVLVVEENTVSIFGRAMKDAAGVRRTYSRDRVEARVQMDSRFPHALQQRQLVATLVLLAPGFRRYTFVTSWLDVPADVIVARINRSGSVDGPVIENLNGSGSR